MCLYCIAVLNNGYGVAIVSMLKTIDSVFFLLVKIVFFFKPQRF